MTTPFLTAPTLAPLTGITHGFFGRKGGVSQGLYESLNAGPGSADASEHVTENRARIAAALGVEHLLSCHQIHSADAVTVTQPFGIRPRADGMVTRTPGLGLCILSADCTPVLFADPDAGVIGAAHAGWKGALAGVLDATLIAMEALGARRENIQVAIGPTIGPASYEVGPEFRDAFRAEVPGAEALFVPGKGDRFMFDLPEFCRQRLESAGVAHCHNLARDTCAEEDDFFSNRRRNLRGEADYGRNASVIALTG